MSNLRKTHRLRWWVSVAIALSSVALQAAFKHLNLPPYFREKIEARKLIDSRLEQDFRTQAGVQPSPVQKPPKRASERTGVIRLRETAVPSDLLGSRSALPVRLAPLRGYRIALGSELTNQWQATLPEGLTPSEQQAAAYIAERLAYDGLLPALAKSIELLEPNLRNRELDQYPPSLARIGFPIDLAAFFRPGGNEAIAYIRDQLQSGETAETLRNALEATPFDFQPTLSGFACLPENGAQPLHSLRLQIRGGYEHEGFIPTASLDVAEQLVRTLPDARLIASIQNSFVPLLRMHAAQSWGLRRRNQLTILSEPLPVSPWGRDNGVPGIVRGASNGLAILTPRYASMGEGESLLLPGESLLMNGLAGLGFKVVQSPLLFQGGNVMVVQETSGTRTLLLSENEVFRNTALGLRSNEVVRAFQMEFSSDQTVIVPTCSYHLDFDVTVRTVEGKIIALVNDPRAAAAIVVGLGIDALTSHRVLSPAQSTQLRRQTAAGQWQDVGRFLFSHLQKFKTEDGKFSNELCQFFHVSPLDAPGANVRTFCTALDLLMGGERVGGAYAEALAGMQSAIERQKVILEALGWKVLTAPSMPDLRWGINYLNGLHGPARYLMPAYGGFYSRLDEAALAAIRKALGPSVEITPIFCGELQRFNGALHCMISVLPAGDANW